MTDGKLRAKEIEELIMKMSRLSIQTEAGMRFWTDPERWRFWLNFDFETLGMFLILGRTYPALSAYENHIGRLGQTLPQEQRRAWLDSVIAYAKRASETVSSLVNTYDGFCEVVRVDADGDIQLRFERPR